MSGSYAGNCTASIQIKQHTIITRTQILHGNVTVTITQETNYPPPRHKKKGRHSSVKTLLCLSLSSRRRLQEIFVRECRRPRETGYSDGSQQPQLPHLRKQRIMHQYPPLQLRQQMTLLNLVVVTAQPHSQLPSDY